MHVRISPTNDIDCSLHALCVEMYVAANVQVCHYTLLKIWSLFMCDDQYGLNIYIVLTCRLTHCYCMNV